MQTSYPNEIKNFSTHLDPAIDELQDEIFAIETELKKSSGATSVNAADSAKLGNVAASSYLRTSRLTLLDLATIADDTAVSITPVNPSGFLLIRRKSAGGDAAVIAFDAIAGTAFCKVVAGSAGIEASTGIKTGTTGTDAKLTVAAHTDGKLYIENRLGAAIIVGYVCL